MTFLKSKNNLRKIIIAILLVIALLFAILFFTAPKKDTAGNYTMKDKYLTKEHYFDSEKSDDRYEFSPIISENGKKYRLIDRDTKIVSEKKTQPYIHTVIENGTVNEINPKKELMVQHEGKDIAVYLTNKEQVEESLRNPIKVNGFTDYKLCLSKPDVSPTKIVDYYDEVTKTNHKVTLNLSNIDVTVPKRWVHDVKIPITFSVYGADYYMLYGEKIPHNEDVPMLYGKENLLLDKLGLEKSHYRIESFAWEGGEFKNANNETVRKAIAYGSRYVEDYRANYINENVILPSPDTVKLTYTSKENVSGGTVYKFYAKGIYAPVNSIIYYLLGAFLILFFVVIILYVIASQKEKEKGEKYEL